MFATGDGGGIACLHAERDIAAVSAPQVAIAGQSPERKEFRVTVIAQIKNARKPRGSVECLRPKAVIALGRREIGYASCHGRMINLADCHQTQQRPSRLRGSAWRWHEAPIIELVTFA